MQIAKVQIYLNSVYKCRVMEERSFQPGDKVLVEVDYGRDLGTILGVEEFDPQAHPDERAPSFRVLRHRIPDDDKRVEENRKRGAELAEEFVNEVSAGGRVKVRVLRADLSYDATRLFVRYYASQQVDLHSMKRGFEQRHNLKLAHWQVGMREQASEVGGVGVCGRCLCCSCWQKQFPQLSMQMARGQMISMDPYSVNGLCGRLKCCLGFEGEKK